MVRRDNKAHALCNVATSQSRNSTSPPLYANMLCPHLVQSLLRRRRFRVRRYFATLECGTHGESPFQSPLYDRETTQPVHTLSIRFRIRRPHVVLDSGYPLLHKSSSEAHNKRSGTLKQDSRTPGSETNREFITIRKA